MFFTPTDEWMQSTASWRHGRSDLLKKLDAAIAAANQVETVDDGMMREYTATGLGDQSEPAKAARKLEEAKRKAVVADVNRAFSAWAGDQTRKNQEWRSSVRNASGAMTKLYDQLVYWRRLYPGEDTSAALAAVVAARNESIPALFIGAECVAHSDLQSRLSDKMKRYKAAKDATTVVRNSIKLSRTPPRNLPAQAPSSGPSLGALSGFKDQINDMVKSAFGTSLADLVWNPAENFLKETLAAAIDGIKEELAALAPGVGLATSAASVVFHTVKLVIAGITADAMLDLSRKLEAGDSKAALQRVRDWQLRAIAAQTSKLARSSANLASQATAIASCGAAIPMQLAVGIANAILALAEVIADLGIQYKESRALTRYLNGHFAGNPPDSHVFAASPLAAAYYLLNTPDSHIALQLVTIGAPAWQQEVELLKKDGVLKTVITESARLIEASRYRIIRGDGTRYREREGKTTKIKVQETLGMEPLRGTKPMVGIASGGAVRGNNMQVLTRGGATRGMSAPD